MNLKLISSSIRVEVNQFILYVMRCIQAFSLVVQVIENNHPHIDPSQPESMSQRALKL